MVSSSTVWCAACTKTSTLIRNRMPASRAEAMLAGNARISLSNQPVSPAAVISSAASRKAPMASG
ncbi:hypothetical protein D3C81_1906740 [compost metagenome]